MITRVGKIRYAREYYYDAQTRQGRCPLDEHLKMEGEISAGVKRNLVKLSACMSYQSSATVLGELSQVEVTAMTAWRCMQEAGQGVMQAEQDGTLSGMKDVLALGLGNAPHDTDLAAALDGCMVNVRQEGWKELKVGVVFEPVSQGSQANQAGEVIPDVHARRQTYVSHLTNPEGNNPEGIALKLVREAQRRGWDVARQTSLIADGAAWIWNQAERHFPDSAHVVDWYHAKQHVWTAAHLAHGGDEAGAAQWVRAQSDLLYAGQADAVADACMSLAATLAPEPRDKLHSEAGYFLHNRERMQYADFQQAGVPIGSGTVESAAKQYKQRLCASGMRWSRTGLLNLLPFRDAFISQRFDTLWRAAFPF